MGNSWFGTEEPGVSNVVGVTAVDSVSSGEAPRGLRNRWDVKDRCEGHYGCVVGDADCRGWVLVPDLWRNIILLLGHGEGANDVAAMVVPTLATLCVTSRRLRELVHTSPIWMTLIDCQFGQGSALVLAESQAVLTKLVVGARATQKEIEDARAKFFRKARLQFIRLWLARELKSGFAGTSVRLRVTKDKAASTKESTMSTSLASNLYVGSAVLWDRIVIIVVYPMAGMELERLEKHPEQFAFVTQLFAKKMSWKGFPIISWDMLVQQAQNDATFPHLIMRLRASAGKNISVSY